MDQHEITTVEENIENIEVKDELAEVKAKPKKSIDKKTFLSIAGLLTLAFSMIGGLFYLKFGGNHDANKSAEMSVSKPIESDVNDPALNFGQTSNPMPPGMVNVVAQKPAEPVVDQAALEAQAKEEALLNARYKSNVMITGGGNGISVNGAETADPSSQKQMPPELQAIFGAMGMPTGNGAQGGGGSASDQSVASQGGRFSAGSNIAPSANASHIDYRQYMILQGKIVDAMLLTRVKSDLPGQIIAQVTEPVYGEQGRFQLLPAGTRIFGEYSSNVRYGQAEIAAVWRRAITPQGVQIMLDSPSTNGLGVAGLGGGRVNNHTFQTFGTAALLSLIGAGSSNLGTNSSDRQNSMSEYRNAVQQSFADSAKDVLDQRKNIPPTITVENGTRIKILVAKDLNFTSLFSD